MRKITSLLAVFVLLLVLAACGNSSKSSSESSGGEDGEQKLAKELKVFNWGEYISQDLVKSFEKEFGVKVILDTYSANQEMYTKIKSGAVSYDVVFPTDYFVEQMINDDFLLELDMENIPNFEHISEPLKDQDFDPGNKYSVPYFYGSIGLAYNKAKVGEPKSWEDLWNPEYKGHVSMNESAREVFTVPLQILGYDINNPTEEQLEEAKKKLEELHPNVLTYDGTPEAQFTSGEAWIGMSYNTGAAKAMASNPDVGFILPEEGGVLWMDNIAIPKTAENKYTAEVFINYLLEPENSKQNAEEVKGSSPNAAAVELMDEEIKNNTAIYPTDEEVSRGQWYQILEPKTLESINRLYNELKIQ
ncbi:family 1 extracellular solute-binding protein [Bacillus freudenreichii]|nr:family 1 extracellular solute-binding protein [Bacillus freudenreichii]